MAFVASQSRFREELYILDGNNMYAYPAMDALACTYIHLFTYHLNDYHMLVGAYVDLYST